MRRKQRRKNELAIRGARLKRQAKRTARSAAGLTPAGPALNIYETATEGAKLVRAGLDYSRALLKEGRKRGWI